MSRDKDMSWTEKRPDETQDGWAVRMVKEEPLRDLLARSQQAHKALLELAGEAGGGCEPWEEVRRLEGKAQGVALVIGYIEEMLR